MSGLAVAFGDETNRDYIEEMLNTLAHRGRAKVGVFSASKVLLGQNYLRADLGLDNEENKREIPVFLNGREDLRICYDGEIGNWAELACEYNVDDGPDREERLLLRLYQTYGPQMLDLLTDAVFAFVISDGEKLFAARDLLGMKTIFYGKKDDTLYFTSELKALIKIGVEPVEFPPGHYLTEKGEPVVYKDLATTFVKRASGVTTNPEEVSITIRELVRQALRRRVDLRLPTASLLSGGFDSSVIVYEASAFLQEKAGASARLKTFSFGVGESEDVEKARLVAEFLQTDHYELVVGMEEILEVLPRVIYYLESFDPSLVRSSVANYLISQAAREEGFEILLSGEGGDEAFCGYAYLKQYPKEELFQEQLRCLEFLHNNAALRLDRMNLCHSLRVIAPLTSGELLSYAMSLPGAYKMKEENGEEIEKWIFRKAYEGKLPEEIVWRVKQEFSQGSGSAGLLPEHFAAVVKDSEYRAAAQKYPFLRSKEEWYYFNIFKGYFGDGAAVDTVGQWEKI